jgi:pilus assembly protein CpaD
MKRRPCLRLAARGAAAAVPRLVPALLCALLLTACDRLRQWEQDHNAAAVGLSNPEVRHAIGFVPRRETLDVEVPSEADGLSPNQHVDVARFIHRYRREAAGNLVITAPDARRDRAGIAKSLQEIQQHMVEAGVDYRLVRGARLNASASGAPFIKLAYRRPVAVPPACDDWTEDVGRNEARIPYPNWGCATQRNLAVMVDNARDLEQPQIEDPRSGERRAVSWSGYVGASPSAGSDAGEGGRRPAPAQKK